MKKIFLVFGLTLTGISFSSAYGQTTTVVEQTTEIISIRPADGRAYSFPTEAERTRVSALKIAELKGLIAANPNDTARVQTYREMIWRYENATIQPVTGSN